MDWFNLV